MESFNLEFINDVPKEIENTIHQGHVQDEAKHGIVCDFNKFSIILKNTLDRIVAVLIAYTAYKEIYVDDIWVAPEFRGEGLGQKLLTDLEARYKDKGYNNINLVTSAFQAPGFYKKCGFDLEFVRKNTQDSKFDKYFFVKYF